MNRWLARREQATLTSITVLSPLGHDWYVRHVVQYNPFEARRKRLVRSDDTQEGRRGTLSISYSALSSSMGHIEPGW